MKKLIYSLIVMTALAVSFTSCTEESVKPSETCGCQGSGSNDKGW
jgi:hypothetical protein